MQTWSQQFIEHGEEPWSVRAPIAKKKGIGIDLWNNKPMYERHPITKVSSKKGLVKDVWVVTINWECDKCSSYNDEKKKWKKCEYSYINKKLRWIRDVDEKK